MAKINVTLNIDEETLLKESEQGSMDNLEAAISQELGWLRDSGMSVEQWSFANKTPEKSNDGSVRPQEALSSFTQGGRTMNKTDVLQQILRLAQEELNLNGDIGYTMPDGKHHIFIYVDDSMGEDEKFYVIEPNRVEDGAHEPMGDTTAADYNNFGELLLGCMWCMDQFDQDREHQKQNIPETAPKHKWTEDMIEHVEELNNNTPDGHIQDADTILADLVENCDFEENGYAQGIFNIWKDSTDKKAVEEMFYAFTDMEFDQYLMKCSEEITRAEGDRTVAPEVTVTEKAAEQKFIEVPAFAEEPAQKKYEAVKEKIRQKYNSGDMELAELLTSNYPNLNLEEAFMLYAELRQEFDGDKVIYLKPSYGEMYDIGATDLLNSKELKEIVSAYIEPDDKIKIDLGFAKLVAEKYPDENYKEVSVYLEDKDGVVLQDIAVIGNKYHYEKGDIAYEDAISVKVWNDKDSEDYTHDFTVGIYEPEKESAFDKETIWIGVYKDALRCSETVDWDEMIDGYPSCGENYTEILVPTDWLMDKLKDEPSLEDWYGEYTCDATDTIARNAVADKIILDCSDETIKNIMIHEKVISNPAEKEIKNTTLDSKISKAKAKTETTSPSNDKSKETER